MRRLLLALIGILVVATTAGCSTVPEGRTGVTVDDDGRLVVVVAWCHNPPSTVVIEQVEPTAEQRRFVKLSALTLFDGSSLTVSPFEPTPGWTGGSSFVLDGGDGAVFEVAAWPDDDHANLGRATFTLDDVDAVRPDQVIIDVGLRMSMEDFVADAVRRC